MFIYFPIPESCSDSSSWWTWCCGAREVPERCHLVHWLPCWLCGSASLYLWHLSVPISGFGNERSSIRCAQTRYPGRFQTSPSTHSLFLVLSWAACCPLAASSSSYFSSWTRSGPVKCITCLASCSWSSWSWWLPARRRPSCYVTSIYVQRTIIGGGGLS